MDRRRLLLIGVIFIVGTAGCIGGPDPSSADNDTDMPPAESDDLDGSLEIHAINVGQADATLIIAPSGETLLIDSGDWTDDGQTVIEYLDHHDVDRVDHLVATHAHSDHIGGHPAIIEHYETEKDGIGAVWDSGVTHDSAAYERYLDAVEDHDVTLYETHDGDEIPLEGDAVTASVLNPAAESEKPDDLDYNSVTVLIEVGETAALFTGDAGSDAEQRLINDHGDTLDVDIYHAGHHGSATSSSPAFLDVMDPEATIISAAYESQYDHPRDEPLEAFADRDIAAYWTAIHGTIVFESDGQTWTVSTQADATTDPLEIRDEPEVEAEPTDDIEEHDTVAPLGVRGHAPPPIVLRLFAAIPLGGLI